jgi:hypothetical protein
MNEAVETAIDLAYNLPKESLPAPLTLLSWLINDYSRHSTTIIVMDREKSGSSPWICLTRWQWLRRP